MGEGGHWSIELGKVIPSCENVALECGVEYDGANLGVCFEIFQGGEEGGPEGGVHRVDRFAVEGNSCQSIAERIRDSEDIVSHDEDECTRIWTKG